MELRRWSARTEAQERPYISAEKYMILRSPAEFEHKISGGSGKAGREKERRGLHFVAVLVNIVLFTCCRNSQN